MKGIYKLTLRHKLGNDLEVRDGNESEERHEDQEVDLRRRGCEGVDIVPVGHCSHIVSIHCPVCSIKNPS